MKKMILFVMLLSPSVLFGHETIYRGQGEWQNSNGEIGAFSSITKKVHNEDGSMTISKTVNAEGQSMNWTYTVAKNDNGYLTVSNTDGSYLGWGYYFKMDGAKVIIHLELEPREGVHVEKTIHASIDGYKEIGSMSNDDVEEEGVSQKTWRECAKRIFPAEG